MGRRASREVAMKLLYQLEIQKDNMEEQIKYVLDEGKFSAKDTEYILDIVDGVWKNISSIDDIIESNSRGWRINRMSKVDLSILRLSVYEIIFRDDIPYNVSVNEAVELAKRFSYEDAGSFINGILSKVPKELQSEHEKNS